MKTKVKNFKGLFLKELIQNKGISQEKFAEEFGVTTQTISYWISGTKKPNSFNLEMLAKYFDIPQECLTGEFPFLCTNEEYQEFFENIKKYFPTTLLTPIDESVKPFLEYLQIIGKKYKTFNSEKLDKGVISNMSIALLMKSIIDKRIIECFIEFGIISESEERENGSI